MSGSVIIFISVFVVDQGILVTSFLGLFWHVHFCVSPVQFNFLLSHFGHFSLLCSHLFCLSINSLLLSVVEWSLVVVFPGDS